MKILRSLFVVALLSFSASFVLADGVDPLVGIGQGNATTPITVTNPTPTFNLVTAQNSACTIAGDVCAVIPPGMPDAGMLPGFQNDLGVTIPTLTIFIQNGTTPLTYTCNDAELTFFGACTTVSVAGGTDVIFSGGTGVLVPTEFTVDIEGTPIGIGGASDLPSGIPIQGTVGAVVTSPEPGSALMLLFGMLAFALAKVARRA